MTISYDDTAIDEIVWDAIRESDCIDDYKAYLGHNLAKAAHADDAMSAIERLDEADDVGSARYPVAYSQVLALADSGQASAQFHVAKMLANGFGVDRDLGNAVKWYQLAVHQGDLRATVNLALMGLEGSATSFGPEKAFDLLRAAIAKGEGRAAVVLARMHASGSGVPKDVSAAQELLIQAWEHGESEAALEMGRMLSANRNPELSDVAWEWIERAADAGNVSASTMLGYMAESEGRIDEAIAHYRTAARAGNDDAAKALGTLYLLGKGVPADGTEAVKWLRPAALRGHTGAQYNLAIAYRDGVGVIPNRRTARKWMKRAARGGDINAKVRYAEMTIEEAPAEAVGHLMDAAKAGNALAQARLGLACKNGCGIAADPATAYKWIRLSALQKEPLGLYLMGWATQAGVGVKADAKQALAWFRKGAELGDAASQYRFGVAHLVGEGTERDIAEAAFWLTKSADQGFAEAERAIGMMFLFGDGVEENAAEAANWLESAARKNDPHAQFVLGRLYASGQGVNRDTEVARDWIERAAALGHSDARDWLQSAQ